MVAQRTPSTPSEAHITLTLRAQSARNTLRPVTIAQIRSAQQSHADADFKIDGVDVGQLTFVAVVRNISRNATNVSFNVEDGTGSIDVRQWLDSNSDDTGKASEIASNQYVRVLGTIKSFQGKKSISSGHMRVVPDYNEVLFHKLEAVWVHLQLTGAGGAGAGATMNANTNVDMDSNGGGGDFSAITSPVQRKIAQAISMLAGPDSEGITAKEVHGKLPSMALATIACVRVGV